jgi:F0F1-type ATP synthase membrane subunit b/b'
MPRTNRKPGGDVATSPLKKKNAMDSLLQSMDQLAVAASKKMTTEEVGKVRKEINDLVDRVVARKPRRETA